MTEPDRGSGELQLLAPTSRLHDSWLQSRDEWGRGVHQDGGGLWEADDLDLETREGFSAWLERLRRESDTSIQPAPGKVHATYWWISQADVYLGAITLRHGLNAFLLEAGGHIGYGITGCVPIRDSSASLDHRRSGRWFLVAVRAPGAAWRRVLSRFRPSAS